MATAANRAYGGTLTGGGVRACACRIAALLAGAFYVEGAVWNFPVTRWNETWCRVLKDGVFRRAALLSLAATTLSIASYIMLRAQAPASTPSTAPAPAAGGAKPKPDVPRTMPPAGEAVAIPLAQWSGQGSRRVQEPLPEVSRHPVGGYSRTPYRHLASPPRRQAQQAVEVMMA